MVYKNEFLRRLNRLYDALDTALQSDIADEAEKPNGLFPALYSVYSYLWSNSFDIYKLNHATSKLREDSEDN